MRREHSSGSRYFARADPRGEAGQGRYKAPVYCTCHGGTHTGCYPPTAKFALSSFRSRTRPSAGQKSAPRAEFHNLIPVDLYRLSPLATRSREDGFEARTKLERSESERTCIKARGMPPFRFWSTVSPWTREKISLDRSKAPFIRWFFLLFSHACARAFVEFRSVVVPFSVVVPAFEFICSSFFF